MLLKYYITQEIIIVDGYIIYAEVHYKFKMSAFIIMMESQEKNICCL